jgi:predicted phosphodiesterase
VPAELTRIFSDLHYGDRASGVKRLTQLRPLLDGITALVLNGDTLDTRPGPRPQFTAEKRAEVVTFTSTAGAPVTLLTGNHDPDLSDHHALELAGGQVFVTHGDIIFDNIVPWSRDATLIGRRIAAALLALPPADREQLEARLNIWRRVAAGIPQQHQSEPHRFKYALRFATDTVWPPLRIFRILRAWQVEPALAAALAHRHRPAAKFIVVGHTHRPRVWRAPNGVVVINTGSFCQPFGGYAVDLTPGRLTVRCVEVRGGDYHPGATVAEFALAET